LSLAERKKRAGKKPEEIQKRCAMMGDYMAYEWPEEDETRQPQPEEPEEYWKKQSAIRAAMMGDYMAYAEEKNAETV